jgi:hypothetical protein
MSYWTEVLLTASILEDDGPEDGPEHYPAVDAINGWLREQRQGELFLIQNPDPERQCPYACFAGMFKSLDEDGFVEAVRAAPWQCPERVQLFMRSEHDERFRPVELSHARA